MKEEIVAFVRSKDYKLVRNIGQGGTGKTVLLRDETIDEEFVCKKYSTYFQSDQSQYFQNFIDEIKLLHLLYHRNVVRIFNYYLYPEKTTGYILMEFINGQHISDYLNQNPENINEIFRQTISGFRHLEENGILHRDLRPENILVSENGVVKVIDLGFGKKIDFEDDFENSISLNWRYPKPDDFNLKIYNYRTEVYFVGKMFEEIIAQNNIQHFAYSGLLNKMIKTKFDNRIESFFDVYRGIISGDTSSITFSHADKQCYRRFADVVSGAISKIDSSAKYTQDLDMIIMTLENIYKDSMLEEYVQTPVAVLRCFINGSYHYINKNNIIGVGELKDFHGFMKSISYDKQKIVLNNLWKRFDQIQRYQVDLDDDLPF